MAIRHARAVVGCWLLVLLVASLGVARLEIDTSTDSILDRTSPAYAFHRESQAMFGGEEILVAAIQAAGPFDPAALREVQRLSSVFAEIPDVRRVDSLDTVPLIRASPDGALDLGAPLRDGVPDDPASLDRLTRAILADRVAPRSLVSQDGLVLAVNLLIEADTKDGFLDIVERVRGQIDPTTTWISGVPVFRTEINTRTQREILLFVPITVGIMALLSFLIFRSLVAVVAPIAIGGVGAVVMLGAMGAAGTSITLLTMTLPTITLALGTAYSMHVLAATAEARSPEAFAEALRRLSLPLALSGLTTAIGFLSMAIVRIDAVREVGVFGGIGVLAVTAAVLTLLPAALCLTGSRGTTPRLAPWLSRRIAPALVRHVMQHSAAILAVWVGIGGVLGLGLWRLDVQTDATNWFPPGTTVRDDYDAIRQRLSGISPVNVVIAAEPAGSVIEPPVLAAIDALTAHLARWPGVGKAVSVADPLRQIHGGFMGDDAMPLPGSRPLAEQYLVLLESVEPIFDLVTADRSHANVLLRVDDNESGALIAVAKEAERWWAGNGPPGTTARGTGTMFEFARAEDEMTHGQLRGLALALISLLVVLLAVFRSVPVAGVALLTNALPIAAAFGVMGLLGVALDAGTVIVGSLALGMAVDDTMHVLAAHHDARIDGRDTRHALDAALGETLPAVSYTTVVVTLGFGVLAFSDFTFIRNFGMVIAGIMCVCWLADVHFLPALLARSGKGSVRDGTADPVRD